jgi:hypothetical protein
MKAASETAVHWPTLRSKLWPITVLRLSGCGWARPSLHEFCNWYYGNYWGVTFGPWIILGGACEMRPDNDGGAAP